MVKVISLGILFLISLMTATPVRKGGETCQFDGDILTKTNEFWSWQPDGSRKGQMEQHRSGKLLEVYTRAA